MRLRSAFFGVTACALVFGLGAILLRPSPSSGAPSTVDTTRVADPLGASIARAQARLKLVPGDYATWAGLGAAYTERARVTVDPTYYPKAEGALRKSLALHPDDNDQALSGLGALANARHDFATARDLAQQALKVNPYSAGAYGVLTDADTQLGDSAGAGDAVQHMLNLQPGVAALTRASYDLELHGRLDDARALMTRALTAAIDPADIAFCRFQLDELAWQTGDLDTAQRQYTAGLAADRAYLPLVQGRAKVETARGDTAAALADYATLTNTAPTAAMYLEDIELLQSAGRTADATTVLTLANAGQAIFVANGGVDDLTGASLALAQHNPAEAVRLAGQEWQRRQFSDVADVLAAALHAAGRDADALAYANKALSLGARNAKYFYHRGVIELALGDRTAARADLGQALALNPHFSPLDAPAAQRALSTLVTS